MAGSDRIRNTVSHCTSVQQAMTYRYCTSDQLTVIGTYCAMCIWSADCHTDSYCTSDHRWQCNTLQKISWLSHSIRYRYIWTLTCLIFYRTSNQLTVSYSGTSEQMKVSYATVHLTSRLFHPEYSADRVIRYMWTTNVWHLNWSADSILLYI